MDISDAELRRRLVAKGYDPPPVTDSSRKVLLRKLTKLEADASPLGATKSVNLNDRSPSQTKSVRRGKNTPSKDSDQYDFKGFDDSSVRLARNLRRDNSDLVASKTSTPQRAYDPFEQGSDSDDSIPFAGHVGRTSTLARKPLESRRDGDYSTNAAVYNKYKFSNGTASFSSSRTSRSHSKSIKSFVSGLITPTTILGAFALFFVVVGVIYFSKNDHTFGELSLDDVNKPACSARGRAGVSCVPDEQMEEALKSMRVLYRTLWTREKNAICAASKEHVAVGKEELSGILSRELDMMNFEADKATKNVAILANTNADLKVVWSEKENGFRLRDVQVPWSCTFRLWCSVVLDYIVYVAVMLALVYSMHILYSWGARRYEERNRGKQELVKSIVEILHQNALANPSQTYLPIVHIRDQLISYADRDRKRKMWSEAVKYVEENESRVRKEVQPFQGEDYDVWRWVGVPQQSSSPKPKTWQGEAFETSKDTINVPATSPTPCLKIRHMFDPKKEMGANDWVTGVSDAILERCEGVKIVHIMVDEANPEGCVYMKCASTEDAGKAYRKIHGAWYDGKIVTVKYLRTERYHERFPSSAEMNTPLVPSNDQKRSLA